MAVATAIPTNSGCKNVDPFAAAASKSHIINHHYVPAPLPPPRSSSSSTAHRPRRDSSFPQCHTTLITRRSRSSLFSLSLSLELVYACPKAVLHYYKNISNACCIQICIGTMKCRKSWLRLNNTINALYICSVYVLLMDVIVLL